MEIGPDNAGDPDKVVRLTAVYKKLLISTVITLKEKLHINII